MRTILLKSRNWIFPLLLFAVIAFTINLNLVSKVDQVVNRMDFEEFLNEKVKGFIESRETNSDEVLADSPDMAALQDYLNTVDPNLKRVPKERLKTAWELTHELARENKSKSTKQLQWYNTQSNMAGRVRAIMWDPNDPNQEKVWAGAVTGGLWYKEDITTNDNWAAVDDFWPGLSVSCIAFDPNNPQNFYVGTGEAQTALIIYRESSGVGFGIVHSTDAGENWEIMPDTEEFEFITDIKVRDENGTSVIYAAVASGVYKGASHISNPSDGLYRKVVGSEDWEQVLPDINGLDSPYTPSDIEFGADGRIYVGTMQNINGDGGATILFSDSGLEGSWTVNDEYNILISNTSGFNLPGRVVLATAPSDEDRVYACIAQGFYYGIPGYECHILVKSLDKGENWDFMSTPPNVNGGNWAFIAWHALMVTVDPNDANKLYVGALDMFRSDDAGETWSKKSNWQGGAVPDFVHADQHGMIYQPGSSQKAIISTDGGVFYTFNAGLPTPSFTEKNFGFNTLQFYKCDIDPTPSSIFFIGGMQDNGTIFYDGNPIEVANRITGGDGGACFIDKNEPDVFITSYQNNRFFLFGNYQYQNAATQWPSGNFISSVDYDYNLNTLYANAVTVTNFMKDSILRISGIPYGPVVGEFMNLNTGTTVPFTHVKYSEYSPENMATLYCGSQSGRLFKVENAQDEPLVSEIGDAAFPGAAISCVALKGSEDTMLVTFSNFGVSSVWQSYDNGQSWSDKEGNLPDMPVRWAIYHPDNAKAAMLATEIGVWTSWNLDDEQPVWNPDVEGLANVRVDMLRLRTDDNMVVAGTHGRGLYFTTYANIPSTGISNYFHPEFSISPNPTNGKINVRLAEHSGLIYSMDVMSISGHLIKTEYVPSGKQSEEFDFSELANGSYIIKINTNKGIAMKKVVKH
ncbi:MAG: T9SS type A sorting domain-containing protein [Bacteroidales bacterium]